ncbi:MAG: NADH-quinone oxidoreductase subunit C [Armatimonadetes bacterium]|nr:NADH-quinone oxidoreductase subunit C [Armatimonadota bacterium]
MGHLSPALEAAQERLAARFGERVEALPAFRGELTIVAQPADVLELLTFLRDDPELDYRLLADVTAVDRQPADPRFEVVYHLFSLSAGARLRIRVPVAETRPVPSVTGLWSGANFMEREVFDMFGIAFQGHPNLQRILTPDEFEGHPLRRDFPIGSIPVTFDIPHRKRFSDATD